SRQTRPMLRRLSLDGRCALAIITVSGPRPCAAMQHVSNIYQMPFTSTGVRYRDRLLNIGRLIAGNPLVVLSRALLREGEVQMQASRLTSHFRPKLQCKTRSASLAALRKMLFRSLVAWKG